MSKINTDCPFCEPLVLKACFAEEGAFRAIYNIAPILPGHSLIVPKKHTQSLLDLTDKELSELVLFSKKIIQLLNKAFGTTSFDWTLQDGVPAGQTIRHLHLHIIPRAMDDLPSPGDWYPQLAKNEENMIESNDRQKLTAKELNTIVSHLKKIF
jgi:bis(5'-adenosyl)-triphosphatase